MTSDQIVRDLAHHFQDRLIQLWKDEMDTARRVDLDMDDMSIVIMQSILQHAAYTAIRSDATKRDFLLMCSQVYDDMAEGAKRYEQSEPR